MANILITGAKGQIGSDLVTALREQSRDERIVATDLQSPFTYDEVPTPYEVLDVRDRDRLRALIEQYEIDTVFHLASLLSATGEQKPDLCWDVNLDGLRNVLDAARTHRLRVFWPSSIAVFGPDTPKQNTPQTTVLDPTTIYGITKVTGELLCRYYADQYGVDVRSVRFPGIISHNAPPGGGTTDYAVNIFYAALERGSYTCFVQADTRLPMMYMPDAVRSMLEIMRADPAAVRIRTSYNLAAVSFSAEELAAEIRKHIPGFECRYEPDFHQAIADSWPAIIDDSRAREDWGWRHDYDLSTLAEDMLENLSHKLTTRGNAAGTAPRPASSHR
jgi:nucleoside-diphosphate-sugar epimerase